MPESMPEKRYAYLVLNALFELRTPDLAGVAYTPTDPPEAGDIVLQEKNHGTGTHTFKQEDGPLVWTLTATYLCTGVLGDDDIVRFDYGGVRILNLIKMGWDSESIMRATVHDAIDGLKAIVDETLHDDIPDGRRNVELLVGKFDAYEKGLWRKH